ncbi:MAG: ATP-binding cassette domain-containing protein [Oligosphaeraceae bacterium]
MTPPLLAFHKVTFQWPGAPAPVLRRLQWAARPGETWLLRGPSGCGKTTFLRLAARLLAPQEGAIRTPFPLALGFVFQEPRLLPWLTLRQNLLLAAPRAPREQREELLRKAGLEDKADCRPPELSGGEAQRGNLVRALLASPHLLLLDEPFSALDPQSARRCVDLLEEWNRNPAPHAMILATHQKDYQGICNAIPLDFPLPAPAE